MSTKPAAGHPSVLSAEDRVETGAATLYGIPIRNVWHMLLYAWGEAAAVERWRREAEAAPSLDALLASVLIRLVEQRLRVGLGRGYEVEAASIRGIRGRIDFAQSLKTLEFERGKAYCRFHVFTADIPRNRTIRAVLDRLAKAGALGPLPERASALRQRLRRLVRDFDEITPIPLRPGVTARETTGWNDSDYRLMLAICELVLRRQMPTEVGGGGSLGLDRDTLTLHAVFEQFVATFLQAHLSGWQVHPKKVLTWPTLGSRPLLPRMEADVVLQEASTGRIIVPDLQRASCYHGSL